MAMAGTDLAHVSKTALHLPRLLEKELECLLRPETCVKVLFDAFYAPRGPQSRVWTL
jgi:hypothetical protein